MLNVLKKYKQLMIGVVIGITTVGSVGFAANSKTIEAFYKDIKISVNGKAVNTGEDQPFVYNGRTYIPARYVAEPLGATVKWNETTNTVEITSDLSSNNLNNLVTTDETISSYKDGNTINMDFPQDLKTSDGVPIFYFNYVAYVGAGDIFAKYGDGYYFNNRPDENKTINLYKVVNERRSPLLQNIPYLTKSDGTGDYRYFITYDYYINTILPLLK